MEGDLLLIGVGHGKAVLGIPGNLCLIILQLQLVFVLRLPGLILFHGIGDFFALFIPDGQIIDIACPGVLILAAGLLFLVRVSILCPVRVGVIAVLGLAVIRLAAVCIGHVALRQGDGSDYLITGLQIDLYFCGPLALVAFILPDLGNFDLSGVLLVGIGHRKGMAVVSPVLAF